MISGTDEALLVSTLGPLAQLADDEAELVTVLTEASALEHLTHNQVTLG